MSNRYMTKMQHEKRAAAKGERKIGQRGMPNRRVVNGFHVTKGRHEIPASDIAETPAGDLYRTWIGG